MTRVNKKFPLSRAPSELRRQGFSQFPNGFWWKDNENGTGVLAVPHTLTALEEAIANRPSAIYDLLNMSDSFRDGLFSYSIGNVTFTPSFDELRLYTKQDKAWILDENGEPETLKEVRILYHLHAYATDEVENGKPVGQVSRNVGRMILGESNDKTKRFTFLSDDVTNWHPENLKMFDRAKRKVTAKIEPEVTVAVVETTQESNDLFKLDKTIFTPERVTKMGQILIQNGFVEEGTAFITKAASQ